jgi:hypothetical protein
MTITSLPRPALIAIVGAVAAIALFALTRRSSETATTVPSGNNPVGKPVVGAPSGNPAAPPAANATPRAPSASRTRAPAHGESNRSGARRQASSRATRLPTPVKKALDAHKVVVLLFWNPAGTDDRSVKKAVNGLPRRGGKVAVFSDRFTKISRYTKITAATNLSQTPTIVVVNRRGQARVATGYHDRASVEQLVVDALHGA